MTDVVVLGSSFRGLWLATELVRLGWSVTWIQLHAPHSNKKNGFVFDDWSWQLGPVRTHSPVVHACREFIDKVIQPDLQELAVQILTPEGPLELSGPACRLGLRYFFKKSLRLIEDYLAALRDSHQLGDKKAAQALYAHSKKIFKRPLGERWPLEWLGSLRRARALTTAEWVLKWDGEVLDPGDEYWILKDGLEDITERAAKWAEKNGVQVLRSGVVADIGIEGRTATGVEVLGGQGFINARKIIVACSYQTLKRKLPRFAEKLQSPVKAESEVWAWVRCGFLLSPHSKPEGLDEFSSFVIDPYMPLSEANMGLLRWRHDVTAKNDQLTVWVRIPFNELKRRSFLMNLTDQIQRHLGQLLPRFGENILAVLPFEEYFHSPDVGHDDVAVSFSGENRFASPKTRLRNVWLMGPGCDRGLELLSRLATEFRLFSILAELRKKELKKSDRTLHSSRNGPSMEHPS